MENNCICIRTMLCNEEDQPNIIFAFNLKVRLIELVHLKLIISLGDNNGRLDICTQIEKCIFFSVHQTSLDPGIGD